MSLGVLMGVLWLVRLCSYQTGVRERDHADYRKCTYTSFPDAEYYCPSFRTTAQKSRLDTFDLQKFPRIWG